MNHRPFSKWLENVRTIYTLGDFEKLEADDYTLRRFASGSVEDCSKVNICLSGI
jgi:hypothetical protein